MRSLKLAVAPADALRRAEALARSRGWEVARVDPQAGTLEATAETLFFRFKDDVVVRVRPDPARAGGVDRRHALDQPRRGQRHRGQCGAHPRLSRRLQKA